MKRVLIGVCFIMMISSAAMANIFVDGYGALVGTYSAEWQYGGGGALGFSINDNFAVMYRGMYTVYTSSASNSDPQDQSFSHMMHLVGLEYDFPLEQFMCVWRSSIMLGFSMTELIYEPTVGAEEEKVDMGMAMAFWTGIQYNATQHLCPFIDLGFHYSYYTQSLDERPIFGLHIMAGIRYYLDGSRRITNNY